MNMEDMSFPADRLDAVAMSATLPYADDTRAALSEVARVLKPGGRFTFSTIYDPESPDWPGNRMHALTIKEIKGPWICIFTITTGSIRRTPMGAENHSIDLRCDKEIPGEAPLDPLRL